MLRCEGPQYAELTVEFLSTFRYNTCSLTSPGAVSFALRRTTHRMSVIEFAVSMGIFSREEVAANEFEGLLWGVSRAARPRYVTEEEMAVYRRSIVVPPHTNRRQATQIRDPLFRYIHRILANTLIPPTLVRSRIVSRRSGNEDKRASESSVVDRAKKTKKLTLGVFFGSISSLPPAILSPIGTLAFVAVQFRRANIDGNPGRTIAGGRVFASTAHDAANTPGANSR
ncbi:hypothetical protein R6Q57_009016 [Mikania cordata]